MAPDRDSRTLRFRRSRHPSVRGAPLARHCINAELSDIEAREQ